VEKTEETAQFLKAITQASELSFPVVFHVENCAVHSGNPTVSSVASKQQTTTLFYPPYLHAQEDIKKR
jgi:hypothetical protein